MDNQLTEFNLPFPQSDEPETGSADPIRRGGPCPRCGNGKLDYNGLLELECPTCGYVISGGSGCT